MSRDFPDDYIIDHDYTGKTYPRSEQVRSCGNAVCPPIPAALVRANLPELCVAERMPKYADRSRADRTAPVCVNLKFCGGAAMIQTAEDEEKQ